MRKSGLAPDDGGFTGISPLKKCKGFFYAVEGVLIEQDVFKGYIAINNVITQFLQQYRTESPRA